jgi:methyl-accepting chemotaxis protein
MENQIKQLIENYKTEISELRNRISDSNETYNEGGYECETDYEHDQTRWGYQITSLVRVVEDLAKL